MNQCDGCRRGLPLSESGTHISPKSWDLIGCTAHLYDEIKPLPADIAKIIAENRWNLYAQAKPHEVGP